MRAPSSRRILVTGTTGNVGREVVRSLRARGIAVRSAGRGGERAPSALEPGIEHVALDFLDPRTFGPAADGCDALFLMRPPPISDVESTLNAFVDAARARGVHHVVFLSVAGAGDNPFVPHHAVEKHLAARGDAFTLLRPGFFAQNLADAYRRDIVEDGRLHVPAGRAKVAFVDVRDVAEIAALVLADPAPHRGRAYTLTGPEAVTFDFVAAMLSEVLERPIRYEPVSILGYGLHLRRRGLPLAQIAVQTILHVGLRAGQAEAVDPTMRELLGRNGTNMQSYIRDHASTWRARD